MLDRRFLATGAAIAVTAVIALFLIRIPPQGESVLIQEPILNIPRAESGGDESPSQEINYAYILKEYNGHIAVFLPDSDEPQIILDTLVKFLPDYDRIQMKQGIPVKDFASLSSLIEDYGS